MTDAEALARRFHETYERLAPSMGYRTRESTRDFDPETRNGKLMIAVCGEILERLQPRAALGREEVLSKFEGWLSGYLLQLPHDYEVHDKLVADIMRHANALTLQPRAEAWRAIEEVDFYEREFYPLSNFSSFNLDFGGRVWPTSEYAYHGMKFTAKWAQAAVFNAPSAHEAFKFAERNKTERRPEWDDIKVDIMRRIIRAKAEQHEYVRRKLLETGERPLVEGSWRDDFWGIGPNRDGQNMLGKLWMELRAELQSTLPPPPKPEVEG